GEGHLRLNCSCGLPHGASSDLLCNFFTEIGNKQVKSHIHVAKLRFIGKSLAGGVCFNQCQTAQKIEAITRDRAIRGEERERND
ncbi:hypothetical protein R0K18_28960, partial [Pantoea sp. SIMBA_133]